MPIYEFKCLSCGGKFDDLVKQGVIEKECPKCGGISYKQLSKPSLGGFDKYGRSK